MVNLAQIEAPFSGQSALTSLIPSPDKAPLVPGALHLRPSRLRPNCQAAERLFLWKGVNSPPPSTICHPAIVSLEALAAKASLRDTSGYGAGLRKFHLFCDAFSIPEHQRLPASFELLHSFALWAAADPDLVEVAQLSEQISFEPVAPSVVRKYLAAVRAWHIVQGWPAPLEANHLERIHWSLRGLENLGVHRHRPPRPLVTIQMIQALKSALSPTDPFDTCIWALASCAFFGMMRFGEVSVRTRTSFTPSSHITRAMAHFGTDLKGAPYARLDLPAAKTARPGETQSVFLNEQGNLCPLTALRNMASVTPAGPSDPLFSWQDASGAARPMVKTRALNRINSILSANGWGSLFGHSFRIGGASFYLARKVDPEIVRLAGRWKSLAYQVYIRAFEQITSQHLANAANDEVAAIGWDGHSAGTQPQGVSHR